MDPNTSEATAEQLARARAQGQAYGRALEYMSGTVAHDGGEQRAGDYLVGHAVEEAEGMYEWVDGALVWREPGEANLHVEVAVRDAGDGRFVPGERRGDEAAGLLFDGAAEPAPRGHRGGRRR